MPEVVQCPPGFAQFWDRNDNGEFSGVQDMSGVESLIYISHESNLHCLWHIYEHGNCDSDGNWGSVMLAVIDSPLQISLSLRRNLKRAPL